MYLGPRPVVVLCGTDSIREALMDQSENFSGRAPIAIIDQIFQGYGEALKGTVGGQGGGWAPVGKDRGGEGPRVSFQSPL